MRINLIPPELRPAEANSLPYFVLAGLIAASGFWFLGQLTAAVKARNRQRQSNAELQGYGKVLQIAQDLDKELARAQQEHDELTLRAACVTVLTQKGLRCSEILRALAETTPEELRLTEASLDPSKPTATLLGYGNRDGAEIEVASFLRALNDHQAIRDTFSSVNLDFCNSGDQGKRPVKIFSMSMPFREDKLTSPPTKD